jgi:type VI secretion system secreted protein Hcp
MAIDAYLKIVAKHVGEIDVIGWEWGAHSPSDQEGRRRGRLRINNITVTKKLDAATVPLLMALDQNKTIEATIINRKASGTTSLKFFEIVIARGRITSLSRSAADGMPEIIETLTLAFADYTESYTPQDAVGMRGGDFEHQISLSADDL